MLLFSDELILNLKMQVAVTNDVKIYNLSAGKSLPDWISAQKRRKLCKDDVDIAKRIELIEAIVLQLKRLQYDW